MVEQYENQIAKAEGAKITHLHAHLANQMNGIQPNPIGSGIARDVEPHTKRPVSMLSELERKGIRPEGRASRSLRAANEQPDCQLKR